MTRTRRSFWSYLSGVAFSLATFIVALVSTPLLLAWLGEERLGAYRAASDWGGYLSLLELGLGGALLPLLVRSLGRNDGDALQATLAAGIRAYTWIALAMLTGGLVLGATIAWLVPVNPVHVNDLRCGFAIGLLAILFLPLAPFRMLAEADQKAYVVHVLLVLQSLFITGLALLLAWKGWGITGQYLAAGAGAIGFQVLLVVHVHRLDPGLIARAVDGRADHTLRRELWKLNWPTLIHNVCGRVSLLTDNIVIALLLGPAAVVPFFLTQRLAMLAQGQLQGIGNASWAGLAELEVKGERETFGERLGELTSLVAILGMACMVPILAYNRHFIRLWVTEDRFGGELLTLLAVGNGFLQALFSLWGWVFGGTGRIACLVPVLVVGTVLNLAASVVCTWLFGLPGPLLGTFIAFVGVYAWALPWLLREVFGISPRLLLGSAAFPVALGLPCAAVVGWVARSHTPWGWFSLGAEMVLAGGAYLLLAWWLILGREKRVFWKQQARLALSWGSGR